MTTLKVRVRAIRPEYASAIQRDLEVGVS